MISVSQALLDDVELDLELWTQHQISGDRSREPRHQSDPKPHVFSDEVPEILARSPAFREVFESVLEGLEGADYEGLGSPHNEEAEATALYVWSLAQEGSKT